MLWGVSLTSLSADVFAMLRSEAGTSVVERVGIWEQVLATLYAVRRVSKPCTGLRYGAFWQRKLQGSCWGPPGRWEI